MIYPRDISPRKLYKSRFRPRNNDPMISVPVLTTYSKDITLF